MSKIAAYAGQLLGGVVLLFGVLIIYTLVLTVGTAAAWDFKPTALEFVGGLVVITLVDGDIQFYRGHYGKSTYPGRTQEEAG